MWSSGLALRRNPAEVECTATKYEEFDMTTLLALLVAACLGSTASAPASRPSIQKKLIEFGWDEPDTAFLCGHADQLTRSPFDGCVFHVNYTSAEGKQSPFTWECWSKRAFTAGELQQALKDLKAAPLGWMRHSFLRFNTTPADIDWFDDHGAVMNNARLAARLAREGGAAGLLFDIEQYNGQLFNYRKQRDVATKSWEQYAAQVRLRGREVMAALQDGFPDLPVFLTFGYSLPWVQSGKGKSLPDAEYGLLAPFMDGLVEAARGRTRLIDGNELAYGYRAEADFADARRMIQADLLPIVADRAAYASRISVSFGLWMDYDWRKAGWDAEHPEKNVHTPERFEALVRSALTHADEYVWIYTETSRWWSAEGGPEKLPLAYDAALRKARRRGTHPVEQP